MNFLLTNRAIATFTVLSGCFLLLVIKFAPGPRLTYDSNAYIEASQSINIYFNGKNADGHTYLFRPPLIPLYLHFFSDKILAAKWLNAICFILSLWLCYFIAREFNFEPIFLSLFLITVGASYPWLQNHFFVWSEPLFCTLLLLLLLLMLRKCHWAWITLICVLLYFVRKAGLIITTGVFCCYLSQKHFRKAILTGLAVGLVVVGWELLIWSYSEGTTVPTIFAGPLAISKQQHIDAMTAWFLPRNISVTTRSIILFLSIVLITVKFNGKFGELRTDPNIKTVLIIGTVYILVFALLWKPDYDDAERYLSTMIPFAMVIVIAILRVLCLKQETKGYWLLFFLTWMTYPIGRTLYHLLLQ